MACRVTLGQVVQPWSTPRMFLFLFCLFVRCTSRLAAACLLLTAVLRCWQQVLTTFEELSLQKWSEPGCILAQVRAVRVLAGVPSCQLVDCVHGMWCMVQVSCSASCTCPQIHFLRVVLDEGHSIGGSDTTNKHVTATRLRAERRWVMTGGQYSCFKECLRWLADCATGRQHGEQGQTAQQLRAKHGSLLHFPSACKHCRAPGAGTPTPDKPGATIHSLRPLLQFLGQQPWAQDGDLWKQAIQVMQCEASLLWLAAKWCLPPG